MVIGRRHAVVCWPVFGSAACAGTGEGNDGRTAYASYCAYPDGKVRGWRTNTTGKPIAWCGRRAMRSGWLFAEGHVWPTAAGCGAVSTWWPIGFDASYMLFAGMPSFRQMPGRFRNGSIPVSGRYARRGSAIRCSSRRTGVLPDAFDTEAVLMVAAPVEAEIPQEGTVHTAPFRFAHYTGYLRLSPKDMPAALSDERVSRIVLESLEGVPMAGGFTVSIDDAGGGWTLVPGADTESTVTLDCSGSTVTVGELGDCWFALLPGNYGRVAVTVATESGAAVRMERDGLAMASGVIKGRISISGSDTVSRTFTMDGAISVYGLCERGDADRHGEWSGVRLSETEIYVSGSDKYMEFGKRAECCGIPLRCPAGWWRGGGLYGGLLPLYRGRMGTLFRDVRIYPDGYYVRVQQFRGTGRERLPVRQYREYRYRCRRCPEYQDNLRAGRVTCALFSPRKATARHELPGCRG
ncbi:MAG: hypothetical protein ACLUZZ_01880 [Alistipes inops]